MKKLFALLVIAGAISNAAFAQHETSCAYTVLSGTQSSNLTLSASTKYELRGCYIVASGATLTIPAGTQIFAQKSSGAGLYISKGAQINAQGTAINPIVFTSDQDPTYRAAGDWEGVKLGGEAINNVSGTLPVEGACTISAGGTNDADNSGTLQYVQIHYAKSGLVLASVGSATTVDHIEVTHSSRNSFELLGGTANMKYAVSLDPKQNDFYVSYGYRGNMQFALGWRADAAANDASGSRGLYIINDLTGSSNTPVTRPVISNMTLIGPKFCTSGTISTNFQDAVRYDFKGQGAIYNSVLTDWRQYGLNLASSGSVQATANDKVQFSYNSMDNNAAGDYTSTTWASACESNMQKWVETLGIFTCDEVGNQLAGFGTVGYNSSICSSSTPDFRLGTNGLDVPDYTEADLSTSFFNTSFTTRGAFDGSTNWVADWTQFAPQDVDYCPSHRMAAGNEDRKDVVMLAPNPAGGGTYAIFDAAQTGKARVSVLDKISGQPVRTVTAEVIGKGKQRVAINVSGLREGTYVIRIEIGKQAPIYGQLMVQ